MKYFMIRVDAIYCLLISNPMAQDYQHIGTLAVGLTALGLQHINPL